MFDYSHLPGKTGGADTQIFRAEASNGWQIWRRPRGKTMAAIIAIGAGGGGGGFTAAAGNTRGGGGGGGVTGGAGGSGGNGLVVIVCW